MLASWDTDTAEALNELAAWVCASGSIDGVLAPYFVVDPALEADFQALAEAAGVSVRRTRDDPNRPPEWTPTEHQTVFGRVLHTWTGVQGDKSALATQFPRYPRFAPDEIAAAFAARYVRLRASPTDRYDTPAVQLQEDRSDRYYRDLRGLLERVVEDSEEIRGGGFPMYIVGDAAQTLFFKSE